MENIKKTHVRRVNLWKILGKQMCSLSTYALGKHWFSDGTYGKHYENTSCPCEPMDKIRKTHVFRGNQWKTLGKHRLSMEPMENIMKNKRFPLEPMEKT